MQRRSAGAPEGGGPRRSRRAIEMKCPVPATAVGLVAAAFLAPAIALGAPVAPAPAILGPASGEVSAAPPAFLIVAPPGLATGWRLSGPKELSGDGPTVRFPADLPAGRYRLTGWASDAGGTPTDAVTREFRIDPAVAPGPAIAGAPDRLINDSTPDFTWGADPTALYAWSLAGEKGPGPSAVGLGLDRVTIESPLADGAYAFSVRSVLTGTSSTVIFRLDATAPKPPHILAAAATAGLALRFRAAEPGGTFSFQVLDAKGEVVAGPEPLTGTAQIGGLRPGAYEVQVRHTDAAGNASRWSRSVKVDIPAAKGEPTSATGGDPANATTTPKGASFKDQLHHTRKLTPRAGAVMRTRTPLLRWRGLPRGATGANLQVFRLVEREGEWRWTRVYNDDVTQTRRRVPKGRLTNGIYAWRVWPRLGSAGFSAKSLAVSYFVVKARAPAA